MAIIFRVWENAGTSEGLIGCVKSIRVNGRPLDLLWPGSPHIMKAEHIRECSSSPCYELPCLNQGTCWPTDEDGYKCTCQKGFSGERCEIRQSPCIETPCQGGGTCVPLPVKGFVCKCPPGRTGDICDKVDKTLREAVIPEFNGESYLKYPTLENVGKSFVLEVWFMAKSLDGVLLYNGQKGENGDFILLNLKDGHLEFSYNLGSGLAHLVTKEKVRLNTWQIARVRRRKRRGILQLDKGKKVRGKSGPKLTQLNLDMPLYLGGLKNYSEAHSESGATTGFNGAIQKFLINTDFFENLGETAVGGQGVKRYRGPPCLHNLCENGGVCHPHLNRFACRCPSGFFGKFCERAIDEEDISKPISFSGATYLKFPNMVYTNFNLSTINTTFEENWENAILEPWSDIDIDYPGTTIIHDDEEDLYFLEGEDYDYEEGEEDQSKKDKVTLTKTEKLLIDSLQFNFDQDSSDISGENEEYQFFSVGDNMEIFESLTISDTQNDEHLDESEVPELTEDSGQKGQISNHFEVNFRTKSGEGLLIWLSRGASLEKDYLAIALSGGYVELSYNLGKQKKPLRIVSKVKVDDGQWHKLYVHRRKRLGILRVDSEKPVKMASVRGAKTLNTNGKLWIGGTPRPPAGLPPSYYIGFKGCISTMQVENRNLNLLTHSDINHLQFCDNT